AHAEGKRRAAERQMGRHRRARARARLQGAPRFDHAHIRCRDRGNRSDRSQAQGRDGGRISVLGESTPPVNQGCDVMIVRTGACRAGLVVCLCSAAAPAIDCATEAAVLARDQSELPRLEVASPNDRPPYCITFTRCPNSGYAAAVADRDKPRTDYAKLLSRYRCKRTR